MSLHVTLMSVVGQGIRDPEVAILYLHNKTIQPAIDGGKTGVNSVIMKRHCAPLNEPVRTVYQYQIPVEESRSKLSRLPLDTSRHLVQETGMIAYRKAVWSPLSRRKSIHPPVLVVAPRVGFALIDIQDSR
jgi:hypothetical protein